MKLILNTSFPTLNEYIKLERTNKYIAANLKKVTTNKVCYLAREQNFKVGLKKYDVNFTWCKHNNRIDHDNIAFAKKFILDGLKCAGSIKDDSPKYIRNFTDTFILDDTRRYISCVVEFIEII